MLLRSQNKKIIFVCNYYIIFCKITTCFFLIFFFLFFLVPPNPCKYRIYNFLYILLTIKKFILLHWKKKPTKNVFLISLGFRIQTKTGSSIFQEVVSAVVVVVPCGICSNINWVDSLDNIIFDTRKRRIHNYYGLIACVASTLECENDRSYGWIFHARISRRNSGDEIPKVTFNFSCLFEIMGIIENEPSSRAVCGQ